MAKTLLLADGSVTIQRVIELTFSHEDVRVVSVPDGARAIQWLETERCDIVLVDVDLPEVDGYSVAAHMKKSSRLQRVPVLLLAGAFDPVDQDRVRSIGVDGVVVKPFEPQVVVARVKELLAAAPPPVKREVRTTAPMTGPSDSPALAVLRSAAESRQGDEPGRRPTKPEPVFPRRAVPDPEPAPVPRVAQERGTMPIGQPEPLEPPARLVWDTGSTAQPGASQAPAPAPAPAAAAPKVSLASAFSALLAAEQSAQPVTAAPAAAPAGISEENVEEAVKRVLVRMTDELVRRIVVETAERLIKEEIEKIKASPE
jgi:CheY-like chemotaxis protein